MFGVVSSVTGSLIEGSGFDVASGALAIES